MALTNATILKKLQKYRKLGEDDSWAWDYKWCAGYLCALRDHELISEKRWYWLLDNNGAKKLYNSDEEDA